MDDSKENKLCKALRAETGKIDDCEIVH